MPAVLERIPAEPASWRRASLAVALALGLAAGAVASPPAFARPAPESFADLAEEVSPSVVNISVEQRRPAAEVPDMPFPPDSPFGEFFKRYFGENMPGQPQAPQGAPQARGLGSGFIIDAEGYVVTNNHVVDGADRISVTLADGRSFDATLLGSDSRTDLALLKVDSEDPLPAVEWGDSEAIRVGDWVMAVGNPFGLGGTVTAGIVSARARDIARDSLVDFIQIDAPINRGNSGGPTFNLDGEVVGINTAIFSPNGGSVGIGFAIPSAVASQVIADLRDDGKVERSWIGVSIQPVTPDIAQGFGLESPNGALVAAVEPGSPAAEAGLEAGDVVLGWNGTAVEEMRDLPKLVAASPIAQEATIRIWRRGAARTLTVTTGRLQTADATADISVQPAGQVTLPELGLTVANLTREHKNRFGIAEDVSGVVVVEVEPGSRAVDMGLQVGDVIESVSLEPVVDAATLSKKIAELREEGQKVAPVLVLRDGRQSFLSLKIDRA